MGPLSQAQALLRGPRNGGEIFCKSLGLILSKSRQDENWTSQMAFCWFIWIDHCERNTASPGNSHRTSQGGIGRSVFYSQIGKVHVRFRRGIVVPGRFFYQANSLYLLTAGF